MIQRDQAVVALERGGTRRSRGRTGTTGRRGDPGPPASAAWNAGNERADVVEHPVEHDAQAAPGGLGHQMVEVVLGPPSRGSIRKWSMVS